MAWVHFGITSFNPRTRVGCELAKRIAEAVADVSIHAPVWGAKTPSLSQTATTKVSIHAPVWGANLVDSQPCHRHLVSIHAPVWGANGIIADTESDQCFNPRTRVGCEQFVNPSVVLICVSIHAPVWGAKRYVAQTEQWQVSFNPRTRVGCELIWAVNII